MACKEDVKLAILDSVYNDINEKFVDGRYTYSRIANDTVKINAKRDSNMSRVQSRQQAYQLAKSLKTRVENEYNGYVRGLINEPSEYDPITVKFTVSQAYIEAEYNKMPIEQQTDNNSIIEAQNGFNLDDTREESLDDFVISDFVGNVPSMPFKYSLNKILSGKKTITVRDRTYNTGTYKDLSSGKMFNIYSKGNMLLSDYLSVSGLNKDEFTRRFLGEEEVQKEHIKEFLANKRPLEIYELTLVESLDDIIPDITDERFKQAYTNKQGLLKFLKSSLKNEKNPTKKSVLKDRITHLQDQMDVLADDTKISFKALTDMMVSDLNIVKNVVNTSADRASLDFALGLVRNYNSLIVSSFKDNMEILSDAEKANITKTLYDMNQLVEDIQNKRIQVGANLVKKISGRNVLDVNGVIVATPDINIGTATLLDTTDITDPIVQSITKEIKNAISRINLSYNSFLKDHKGIVKNFRKYQKSQGLSTKDYFNFMLEVDDKGKRTGNHVSQYTRDYYNNKFDTKKSYSERLSFLSSEHTISFNENAWKEKVKSMREWYENNIGSSITLTDSQIANNVSLDEVIEQEFNKWLKYRDARTMYNILNRIHNNPTAISSTDISFFEGFLKNQGFFKAKVGDEWVDVINLVPHNQYVSSQWLKIQQMSESDPRKVFYKHYIKNIVDSKRKLQDSDFWTDWNYIPEKLKQAEGLLNKMRDYAVESVAQSISKRSDIIDPITGELTLTIPTYMTGNSLKPDEKDYNLDKVLDEYVKEGMRYEEMSEIEDDVNYMLDLLKSKKVYLTNPDGTPKIVNGEIQYKNDVSNLVKVAKYRIEAQVYEQRQAIEGDTGKKLAPSIIKDRQKALIKEMNSLNLSSEDKEIALTYIKSRMQYDDTDSKIKRYVELGIQYKDLEPLLKTVTGNKIVNTTIVYTALKFLGLNLFAGFAELLQGITSFAIEASGGRYFSDKDGWRAMGTVISSMTPWSTKENNKVRELGRIFGTESEVIHGEAKKSWVVETAFIHYRMASRLINNSFMMAMLNHEKITDKSGVEYSLGEVIDVDNNGRIVLPSNFVNNFYDETGNPSKYFLDLLQKFREVQKNNRDRQSGEDPILLEKFAAGRALGQFKKNWMIRGFTTRFGKYKDANLFLGHDTKGFYRSWWELFAVPTKENHLGEQIKDYSPTGLAKALVTGIKDTLKFTLLGKLFGAKPGENMKEVDVYNMKKFTREMTFISTLLVIGLILGHLGGDGDDDNKRKGFVRWAINQNIRFLRDLRTYSSPESFASIVKNPAPLVSSVVDFTTLLDKIIESTILLDPYNKKGDLKVWKASKELVPVLRQIESLQKKFDKTVSYRF